MNGNSVYLLYVILLIFCRSRRKRISGLFIAFIGEVVLFDNIPGLRLSSNGTITFSAMTKRFIIKFKNSKFLSQLARRVAAVPRETVSENNTRWKWWLGGIALVAVTIAVGVLMYKYQQSGKNSFFFIQDGTRSKRQQFL
jgi:hypothetical protein